MRQKKTKAKIKTARKPVKAKPRNVDECLGLLFEAVSALQTEVGDLLDELSELRGRFEQFGGAITERVCDLEQCARWYGQGAPVEVAARAAASVGGSFEQAQQGARSVRLADVTVPADADNFRIGMTVEDPLVE